MPIKNGSSVEGCLDGFCRRITKPGLFFVLTMLCGLATYAGAQSGPLPGNPETPSAPSGKAAPESFPDAATPASIHGVVSNRDGSVYEGAHVVLVIHAATGTVSRSADSGSDGRFNFSGVEPGPFQLAISSAGFITQTVSGVLHAGESIEVPEIILPMSTATSDVTVTASTVQIAQEQMVEEEKQRVLGVIPNFYVSYVKNAAPLDARQKFNLGWKTSIDPISFLSAGAIAGVQQATNSLSGYGQGAQGYAKRFGANYADTFIGTMLSSAVLPAMLKQDPRYFYKGTGTIRSRIFYAVANSVICKGDNGRWQPNYSGFIGGLAAGDISNLYYPASSRDGAELTFENAGIGIAGGAIQNLFQEFVIRKLTPKIPNYSPSGP